MRRPVLALALLSLGLAGFLAASTLAGTSPLGAFTDSTSSTEATSTTQTQTTTTTTSTSTTTTTTPQPKPKPKHVRLAPGVTIGGVHVGGLTPESAYQAVRLAFRSPLVLLVDGKRVSVAPDRLGAIARIRPAVARAVSASPDTAVPIVVTVRGDDVRSYVGRLAARHDRKVRDARVVLRHLAPLVFRERAGFRIRRLQTVLEIVRAVRENRRGPVQVPVRTVQPSVKSAKFGAVIVIRRGSNRLFYYWGEKLARVFRVATGQAVYPTPLGHFEIVVKWRDPWWYPPPSPWAQGLKPIPPGPGNPLGTRWMGLSAPSVGIHGTPDEASLGYSVSHGCIRMSIPSAEWLFNHVKVGTQVFIVGA